MPDENNPNWPKLSDELSNPGPGILTDKEILEAMSKGLLIQNGKVDNARYASYELDIGDRVEELIIEVQEAGKHNYRGKNLSDGDEFEVYPGETLKLYALEKLYMPADAVATATPVGYLFKLGLTPEPSFVDPGFNGEYYLIVCNYSRNIVTLRVGDPLARLQFFQLHDRPLTIHDGVAAIRPTPQFVKKLPVPSQEDLEKRAEDDILEDVLGAAAPLHYEHAFVTKRVRKSISRIQTIGDAISEIEDTQKKLQESINAVSKQASKTEDDVSELKESDRSPTTALHSNSSNLDGRIKKLERTNRAYKLLWVFTIAGLVYVIGGYSKLALLISITIAVISLAYASYRFAHSKWPNATFAIICSVIAGVIVIVGGAACNLYWQTLTESLPFLQNNDE